MLRKSRLHSQTHAPPSTLHTWDRTLPRQRLRPPTWTPSPVRSPSLRLEANRILLDVWGSQNHPENHVDLEPVQSLRPCLKVTSLRHCDLPPEATLLTLDVGRARSAPLGWRLAPSFAWHEWHSWTKMQKTTISQLCDHVIISTKWCSQNGQMDTELCSAHSNLFLRALVMWSWHCHGQYGGIRKTLNSTPGWWRSRVNFPLANVVVQLFAVYKLFATRLAHTRREEDHRETIGACGHATQKSTICQARGDL